MKKHLLSAMLLAGIVATTHAQTAANYYNAGKASADKAKAMLAGMGSFDKTANDKIIALYKESADDYLKSKEMMPGIRHHASYLAAVSLYHEAAQYHAAGNDTKAYEIMKQVLEMWASTKDIRPSVVTKEKSVHYKGFIYIFPAADSLSVYNDNYYMSRYLLSILSVKQNLPDDALKYAEEVADNYKNAPEIVSQLAYYAANSLHKQGNSCDAGKYAINYLENIARIDTKNYVTGIDDNNRKLVEMQHYVLSSDSQGCIKNKKGEECVGIIAALQEPWKPNARSFYDLGESLFTKGGHSFQLIFSEYEFAMTHGDSAVAHIWDARLEENRRHYSSADWRILAAFYNNYLTKANLRDDAIRRADRKEKIEATRVLIGIEPTVIPLGQYAIGIQVVGKHVSHELRLGYIANGIKPYLKSGSDTDKVPLDIMTHYKGFQVSYGLKALTRGEYNPNAWSYVGLELRYTMRNYSDLLTFYNKNDKTENIHNANLNPTAAVYDATFMFGEIIKGKNLFFEIFGGVGLGYKTISYSNALFDPSKDLVANAPFKADLWNKIYVPVRFGMKFGFVL